MNLDTPNTHHAYGMFPRSVPVQTPKSTEEVSITPKLDEDDEVLELTIGFDYDGFQVVRREFFAHLREPACTFNQCKFSVNKACLKKFPQTDYVQVLVNRETKVLALRPCAEGARDSYMWSGTTKGKRTPKAITCQIFFAKIVTMMDWNPEYRYKLLGHIVKANGEYLIAFDLTSAEVYQRIAEDGEKPKASRKPVFPIGWQDQFGLPVNEHKQSMQISTFDGYAVFAVKDKAKKQQVSDDAGEDVRKETNHGEFA